MALTKKRLTKVLEEVERFTETAKEVIFLSQRQRDEGTKETGACRRASLDLSQALVDLRRVQE